MISIVAMASPAPFTMQPIVAVELDVGEIVFRGFALHRIFFVGIAQVGDILVAEQCVVVEIDLGIEADDARRPW